MTDAPSGTPAQQGHRAARAAIHYVLVALLAGGVMFWRLGESALEEHECKAALAARTMAEPNLWLAEGTLDGKAYEIPPNTPFNHWMVPIENGRPRLVKTPLEYWLVAAVARDGEAVNEWTARLPAALAAVLCVLVTLALGRRMFSPRAALFGAAMLATSVGLQKWGRCARPEMTLCLLTTAAMACFYAGMTVRGRWRHVAWMGAFWVSMGLANLSKEFVPLLLSWGLLAWLFWRQSDAQAQPPRTRKLLLWFLILAGAGLAVYLAGSYALGSIAALARWKNTPGGGLFVKGFMAACLAVPMATYFFAARGWKPILPLLPTAIPGLAVMAGIFLPWFYYMGKLFPSVAGGIFSYQLTERAAGTGAWEAAPPYFYLQYVLTYALPWLVLLPGAFAAPLMKRFQAHRGALMYLFFWAVGIVMLFTYIAGKREHYILPALPAVCLLMGFVAEDLWVLGGLWARPWVARALAVAYGAVVPAGIVAALVGFRQEAQRLHVLAIVAAAGIPLVIGAVLAYRPKLGPIVAGTVITIAAAYTTYIITRREIWVAGYSSTEIVLKCAVLIPMVIGAVLAYRRKQAPMVAYIVIAMVAAYTAFQARQDLWSTHDSARDFAHKAAEIIPPGAPVYQWGDSQFVVPFYFGRYVPALDWQFKRSEDLSVRGGMDPNAAAARMERQRQDWLADPNDAPWVFAYEKLPGAKAGKASKAEDARSLEELGYRVEVSQVDKQDKQYAFTLYHRTPPTASKPGP